jgi:glycosyltransferase involved in cell wall biosynthesis
MSCEIPLIGTPVVVMPDLLEPEALIPPGDVTALGERIAAVITDPALRNNICAQQHQKMQTLGDQDFLDQTVAIYAGLIS